MGQKVNPHGMRVGLNALLLGQRVIYLTGEVNEAMALNFAQQAAYMNSEDDKAPIKVFIDSNGGSLVGYCKHCGKRTPFC